MKSKITVAALLLAVVGGSVAFGVLQNTKFKSNSRAEETQDQVYDIPAAPPEDNAQDNQEGQQPVPQEGVKPDEQNVSNETLVEANQPIDCRSVGPIKTTWTELAKSVCASRSSQAGDQFNCPAGTIPDYSMTTTGKSGGLPIVPGNSACLDSANNSSICCRVINNLAMDNQRGGAEFSNKCLKIVYLDEVIDPFSKLFRALTFQGAYAHDPVRIESVPCN